MPAQALATAPIPPQNLDAEESVLGAMMLSPLAIGAVTESTSLSASDFYRESHGLIYRAIITLYGKGEPVDAITVVDELDRMGSLTDIGGAGASPRARHARPGGVERRPLRADRQRDGHPARADPGRQRHRTARVRPARRDDRAGRPRRADRLRPLAAAGLERVRAHRGAAQGLVRDDHATLRGRDRHHRNAVGLPRHRPPHLRLPAGQPGDRRGAPVDGQVRARALHGRERRRPEQQAGRAVHARDVEGGGHAAADVLARARSNRSASARASSPSTTGPGSRTRATSSRGRRSTSTTPARSR